MSRVLSGSSATGVSGQALATTGLRPASQSDRPFRRPALSRRVGALGHTLRHAAFSSRWSAFNGSLLIHTLALVCFSICTWTEPAPVERSRFLSVCADTETVVGFDEVIAQLGSGPSPNDPIAGGSQGPTSEIETVPSLQPTEAPLVAADLDSAFDSVGSLAEVWPAASEPAITSGVGAPGVGSGTGSGTGVGGGSGSGGRAKFFHLRAEGDKIVYLVDCSDSMLKSHNRQTRRLVRVKEELHRSIDELAPDVRFLVVFFNSNAVPMPDKSPQLATPENKRRVLEWIDDIHGGGATDPTPALALATALKPDDIFLLTDGSFNKVVVDRARQLNTHHARIHTVSMGDKRGEQLLITIAETNGGTHAYVP
ncbi:MAG: VWA domain-containing protein [Planctomycetaceae bacterium]|nr:VWA domain-containing protein [Planctomycetaceae bacterium]